jgi:hypothetical protein
VSRLRAVWDSCQSSRASSPSRVVKALVGERNPYSRLANADLHCFVLDIDVLDDRQHDGSNLAVLLADIRFSLPGRPSYGHQSHVSPSNRRIPGDKTLTNERLSTFPGGSQTLEGYKVSARNVNTSTSPAEVFGGMVVPNVGGYNASSSSSGNSRATTSATASGPKRGDGGASRSISGMLALGAAFLAAWN